MYALEGSIAVGGSSINWSVILAPFLARLILAQPCLTRDLATGYGIIWESSTRRTKLERSLSKFSIREEFTLLRVSAVSSLLSEWNL